MAPKKLIKCCRFTVHSEPNKKILETGKIFFPSPKVGPKPTEQSLSNSTYGPLANISGPYFCFRPTLKIKKKIKISIFSKMAPTNFIKCCRFTVHSKLNNKTLAAFPGKIPETEKNKSVTRLT